MLEFEEPIKNLEDKIEELRNIGSDGKVNIVEEINVLQKKCNMLIKDIYSNLTPWQVTLRIMFLWFPVKDIKIANLFHQIQKFLGTSTTKLID